MNFLLLYLDSRLKPSDYLKAKPFSHHPCSTHNQLVPCVAHGKTILYDIVLVYKLQ